MKTKLLKLIEILSSTSRLDPNTIKRLEKLAEEINGESMPYEKQEGINWKAECRDLRIKLKMAETALDVRNQEAWEERRRAESAEEKNDIMLNAVQMAYRKHHMDDENIGWEELDKILFDTLCSTMEDRGYQKWVDTLDT